jgi:hypothetical protein
MASRLAARQDPGAESESVSIGRWPSQERKAFSLQVRIPAIVKQPDRSMVNAPIGDRDRSRATLGVRG